MSHNRGTPAHRRLPVGFPLHPGHRAPTRGRKQRRLSASQEIEMHRARVGHGFSAKDEPSQPVILPRATISGWEQPWAGGSSMRIGDLSGTRLSGV